MNPNPAAIGHRILVIDDNQQIHLDFRKVLGPVPAARRFGEAEAALFGPPQTEPVGESFEIDSAFQGQEGLACVERAIAEGRPYALAFVDIRMPPGWDGIETIGRLWQCCPDLQVVVCSAYSDYSWADMVGKLGRSDSLVVLRKPFDNVEVLQLAHAMTRKWSLAKEARAHVEHLDQLVRQRTAELAQTNEQLLQEVDRRTQALEELRMSEERFSKAFRATPIPLAIRRQTGHLLDFNDAFVNLTGRPSGALMGKRFEDLGLWASPETTPLLEADLAAGKLVRHVTGRIAQPDGTVREVRISAEPLHLHGELGLLLILLDVTDQLSLESQLRHSQKMEAVGQLASGVAHDFNNLLTVIHGYVALHLADELLPQSFQAGLEQVQLASQRAAALTRQLLTFSRRHVHQPQAVDLCCLASNLRRMLCRLIGEHIELEVSCERDGCVVQGDEASLEQVLMNLVVNARDAMPKGGQVLIRVSALNLEDTDVRTRTDVKAGPYACLTVADNGCGMDAATADRAFEPFFTTKPEGHGTGLGLSTVYGIIRQHGGWVDLHTELGKGTTFAVYLPINRETSMPVSNASDPLLESASPPAGQRILVAEDDQALRGLVLKVLSGQGYSVRAVRSGAEALALVEKEGVEFDLLLTDVVMPGGVNGVELAARLRERRPELRVLFTSGYCPEHLLQENVRADDTSFLCKPFNPSELLLRIRRQFDRH